MGCSRGEQNCDGHFYFSHTRSPFEVCLTVCNSAPRSMEAAETAAFPSAAAYEQEDAELAEDASAAAEDADAYEVSDCSCSSAGNAGCLLGALHMLHAPYAYARRSLSGGRGAAAPLALPMPDALVFNYNDVTCFTSAPPAHVLTRLPPAASSTSAGSSCTQPSQKHHSRSAAHSKPSKHHLLPLLQSCCISLQQNESASGLFRHYTSPASRRSSHVSSNSPPRMPQRQAHLRMVHT
jgi:hypothetical protein